jgi:small GTP-binding protein
MAQPPPPPRRRLPTSTEISALQRDPARLRAVCVVGHVDHGKSSLVDWLLADSGAVPPRLAGTLRLMDDLPDEQERGITLRASAVSLRCAAPKGDGDFLLTIIDSPGHVDFAHDACAACRLADGCLLIVDAIEGVRIQTRGALRAACAERLRPILVVNKLDRLRRHAPDEAFAVLRRIVETANVALHEACSVNGCPPAYVEASTFSFASIIFASAKDGWAFGTRELAKVLKGVFGNAPLPAIERVLFDDVAVDNGKVKKLRAPCSSESAFASLVLAPLFALLADDVTALEAPLFAGADECGKKDRALQVLRKRFPLPKAVQRCVIQRVPPPRAALEGHVMFPGGYASEGGALAYCAKFFAHDKDIHGACRVLRGALTRGACIRVDGVDVEIDALYAMMGSELLPLDTAPMGAIVALGPAVSSAFAGKRGALGVDLVKAPAAATVFPLVKVAVSSMKRADAELVDGALERIRRLDAAASVHREGGQMILGCVGELHLDQVLRDLRRDVRVEVVVGAPIVGFREGVCEETTSSIVPPPWSGELDDDEAVRVRVEALDPETSRKLEAGGPCSDGIAGPRGARGNALVVEAGPEQACVEGFNRACVAGPLAEEPLYGVRVVILRADGDDAEELAGKVRRAIRAAILTRGARVWELRVAGDVLCASAALGKLHGLLNKRRGAITEEDVVSSDLWCLRTQLPASSALGFGEALLQWTSGGASVPQLVPAGFHLLEEDPFWVPTTNEEREEHGDLDADVFVAANVARALVNSVRRRKGLASDARVLRAKAEAQKSSARIKG